jgi:two-component system response regulator RegX3
MRTLERASIDTADEARVLPLRFADSQSAATIILVEVEPLLADSIKYTLERDGYRILARASREAALAALSLESTGLMLVEVPGPSREALEFCRKVRASSAASIILITPTISETERSDALKAGADDFLIKPFSVRVVAQRVSEQLRGERSAAPVRDSDDELLRVGPVEMEVANHEVRIRGRLTFFPPKEFSLLETFLRSRGRLLTRARLIEAVWGAEYYGDGKTLDTHVKRLREKIEVDRRRPKHLIVVRGLGYRLVDRDPGD